MTKIDTDPYLPEVAVEYIDAVVKCVRYRKKVRREVRGELVDHFVEALSECDGEVERIKLAEELVAEFGDVKILAGLIRRGKKRCRPLWKKVLIRGFQGVGICILCFIIYSVWFFNGKANPTVDYLEVFNERNRPVVVDEDNAWLYYEKAINLLVEPDEDLKELLPKFGRLAIMRDNDLLAQDQIAVSEWLDNNAPAWQEFCKAIEMPYCYREYNYDHPDETWILSVMLPHVPKLREIAVLGMSRWKHAVGHGNTDLALRDSITLVKFSRHWQGRKNIIESLLGMTIGSLGCQGVLNVTESDDVTSAQLREMYESLSSAYPNGYPPIELEGEKIMLMDVIQHCFTDGGLGGGHLVPRDLRMIMHVEDLVDFDDLKTMLLVVSGTLVHAGRDDVIAKTNEVYEKFEVLSVMSPFERKMSDVTFDDVFLKLPEYRYFLLHAMLPSLGRVTDVRFENKAFYEATLTVLAVKQWQLETGSLPANLNVLVDAGLLSELPEDPYSDCSLVYRIDGDDFVLYSVGQNFVDDGGLSGTDRDGKYILWGEEGDAVFWPVDGK